MVKKFKLALLILFFAVIIVPGDHIEDDKERWKPYYINVDPQTKVIKWYLPFKTADRHNIKTISVISTFGAHRNSYVRGHIHAGIDMIPKKRGSGYIYVYPIASGNICSIHLGDPHTTIVIKHKLASGNIIFSSYKHFKQISVKNGDPVSQNTRLARLYTRKEARALGGNYDHLHLEIRKKFDDYGVASWATLTKNELKRRFIDPLAFLKHKLSSPR